MSSIKMYRVLYVENDAEVLTSPQPWNMAQITARTLTGQGYTVGSVMTEDAAKSYMEYRYGETYRGVDIPSDLRANDVPHSVFEAWKRGVDAALDGSAPEPNRDPVAPAYKDFQWVVRVHWDADHTSPAVGPFGQTEADNKMRELRRRFRAAGLKPPKMTRELLRSPGALDGWVLGHIEEAKARAEDDEGGDAS